MFEKALHAALRKQVTIGRLSVAYPSGRTEQYGDGSGPPVAIRFADAAALRAVVLDPALAVPEMYMEGRLLLDAGNPYELVTLFKTATRPEVATFGARLHHLRRSITDAPVLRAVGLRSARTNVAHHYDLDERLYRLFLDEDMQYSCAYFQQPDMSLAQAQLAKKRLIAAKLLVRPDARVLDIGCGWGGLALYLARVCGARVTGITLSREQLRVASDRAAAAGLADRIEFRLQDYREVEGRFDNVVSVGMLEHVGAPDYPTFGGVIDRALADSGRGLLHFIGRNQSAPLNAWIRKRIFPGAYAPTLREVFEHVLEPHDLSVLDVENLRLHYAKTLEHWRSRFNGASREVAAMFDTKFVRAWERCRR